MQPLVIVGTGGHGREVLGLIRDINRESPTWEVRGFLDDDASRWGTEVNGVPVLGGTDWLRREREPTHVVVAIGAPHVRRTVWERVRPLAASCPTLIHPSVLVGEYVTVGEGAQVMAGSIITTNITIGVGVLANMGCIVGHDVRVGDFATLAPGSRVAGAAQIAEGVDVGMAASVIQCVSVGAWSIVGAGAAVVRDLPANCTAVGCPARVIKHRPAGWHLAAPLQAMAATG